MMHKAHCHVAHQVKPTNAAVNKNFGMRKTLQHTACRSCFFHFRCLLNENLAHLKSLFAVFGEDLLLGLGLFDRVKDLARVLAVVVKLARVCVDNSVDVAKEAAKVPLVAGDVNRKARGRVLDVHGEDEADVDTLAVRRDHLPSVCAVGEEQPLHEIADRPGDVAKVDRGADDHGVCSKDLLQHRREVVLQCALAKAGPAKELAAKAALAAGKVEVGELDELCLGAHGLGSFKRTADHPRCVPVSPRAAVDTNNFLHLHSLTQTVANEKASF